MGSYNSKTTSRLNTWNVLPTLHTHKQIYGLAFQNTWVQYICEFVVCVFLDNLTNERHLWMTLTTVSKLRLLTVHLLGIPIYLRYFSSVLSGWILHHNPAFILVINPSSQAVQIKIFHSVQEQSVYINIYWRKRSIVGFLFPNLLFSCIINHFPGMPSSLVTSKLDSKERGSCLDVLIINYKKALTTKLRSTVNWGA